MSLYYPGLSEALRQLKNADADRLYQQLDALFGRDNLPEDPTVEDVRNEAIRQTRIEFTDTSSTEYELVEFYKATAPYWPSA